MLEICQFLLLIVQASLVLFLFGMITISINRPCQKISMIVYYFKILLFMIFKVFVVEQLNTVL